MNTNYTTVDIFGTAESAALLSLFVFVPGYVIGWLLDVLGFRGRRLIVKLLFSVPLAIACCPVITYVLQRVSPEAAWVFFAATWVAFAVILAGSLKGLTRTLPRLSRRVWLSVAVVLCWLAVGMGSLVDIQWGERLYYSVPSFDYSVRTAFTAAATRGVPPMNPFFASSEPVPLRYHYFWLLLCSMASRIGHVAPRHAMFGATLWCGIALLSLVALWVKFFLRPASNIERKSLIGAGLLLVTGLDIIPTVVLRFQQPHVVKPDMEWWNVAQITSWMDSLLWVPHHVAGLIACLTGFLVLYAEKRRWVAALVAGVAFASAAGLSIYVTLTFAVFLMLWVPFSLLQDPKRAVTLLALAAVALCLALPYLASLAGPGQGGGAFVVLQVRPFSFATDLLERYGVQRFWAEQVAPVVLLPVNYALELGFFLLIAVDRVRKLWRGTLLLDRDEVTAWLAVAASFVVGTVLRSNTIAHNDLGYRCFLLAQFFMLLWAIPVVEGWLFPQASGVERSSTHLGARVAVACLILGVIGTTYQLFELRIYSVAADHGGVFRRSWMDGDGQLGRRTFALRRAYEQLDKDAKPAWVIQFNPLTPTYIPHLLYTSHPAAAVGANCGTEFGGKLADCAPRINELSRVFGDSVPGDVKDLDEVCRQIGIEVLLAKDSDPVWHDRSSWVWREHPLVENEYVRAFRCGDPGSNAVQTSLSRR